MGRQLKEINQRKSVIIFKTTQIEYFSKNII